MLRIERLILDSSPVNAIRERSKRLTFPGFDHLPVYDVYRYFLGQVRREGLNLRSASISYNLILAIPAIFLFICSLLPYLPISKELFSVLESLLRDLTPDRHTHRILNRFLDDLFNKQKKGLLSLGFVLTLFYASNAIMGIINAFDRSLKKKAKSNFIKQRFRAIRLTIIIVLLVLGTLIISLGQGVLFNTLMRWLHITNPSVRHLIKNIRWVVILLLFFYSIAFLYKYCPTVKKRNRLITPGAFVATGLLVLCTTLFSYWAQNISTYNKFYGSIGSVMLIMLLVYFDSMMLLIGFELDMSIRYLKEARNKNL